MTPEIYNLAFGDRGECDSCLSAHQACHLYSPGAVDHFISDICIFNRFNCAPVYGQLFQAVSNRTQMTGNVNTMRDFVPLTTEEETALLDSAEAIKSAGPPKISDFSKYEDIRYHGIPVMEHCISI